MKTIPMLLVGLAIVWPAYAQSLGEALEQAWTRHPQAAAFAAREDEARARAEIAAGFTPAPPALSLSGLNDRLNRNRGKQEWEAEMAVPLWLPGQKAARESEAESAMAEVAARSKALRLQLAGEVREAWWTVAAARNARDLSARRAETARALDEDVQRRYKPAIWPASMPIWRKANAWPRQRKPSRRRPPCLPPNRPGTTSPAHRRPPCWQRSGRFLRGSLPMITPSWQRLPLQPGRRAASSAWPRKPAATRPSSPYAWCASGGISPSLTPT